MGFLAPLIGGAASILGSIIGGNSQQAPAQDAANAQLQQQQQAQQQLAQQEQAYRQQINQLLPYLGGASGAASAMRNSVPYMAPSSAVSNGGVFGGQQVQSTPAFGGGGFHGFGGMQPPPNNFSTGLPAQGVTPQMQQAQQPVMGGALGPAINGQPASGQRFLEGAQPGRAI